MIHPNLIKRHIIQHKFIWSLILFVFIFNGYFYLHQQTNISNFIAPPNYRLTRSLDTEELNESATYWNNGRKKVFRVRELEEFHKKLDTLPDYYVLSENKRPRYSSDCAHYPEFSDLYFTNQYWQTFETGNGTIQLLSAFYDNRTEPVIRLVSLINRSDFKSPTVCYLWYDTFSEAVVTESVEFSVIWLWKLSNEKPEVYVPYMINCPIPPELAHIVPNSVSLVSKKCDYPSNNLKVIDNRPTDGVKKNFAVCVRSINFGFINNAINLVEWVELSNLLGADLITMYIYRATNDFIKASRYYENAGLMKVYNMTVPGQLMPYPLHTYKKLKRSQALYLELPALQDCFYRNFQKYNYIVVVDIDEVILPVNSNSWTDLFKEIDTIKDHNVTYTEYITRQVRFFTDWNADESEVRDIPFYTPMLSHVSHIEAYDISNAPKGFFDTRFTVSLHNHWPVTCIGGTCHKFHVPLNMSQMNHYRLKRNVDDVKGKVYKDKTIWKFKDELIGRTTKALLEIGMLEKV